MKSIFDVKVIKHGIQIVLLALFSMSAANARTPQYRLIVSFGSECCGIDYAAVRELSKLVVAYEERASIKLDAKNVGQGDEGEYDACFKLQGLSAELQKAFVHDVKTAMQTHKNVRVEENVACRGAS